MKMWKSILIVLAIFLCAACGEEVENISPTCAIISPQQGAQFTYGISLNVEVAADDEDGNITHVMLYVDNREVGTQTEAPYIFYVPASRLTVGAHIIKAIAYDNTGDVCQHNVSIRVNSVPEEVTKYSVGEYYQKGATRGVIYQISADSTHGMLLSLVESEAMWADFSAATLQTLANHTNSGKANHNTLNINYGLSAFPAVLWAANLNDENTTGWYLPAKNELTDIQEVVDLLQNTLQQHGAPAIAESCYWSSTESSTENAWAVDFGTGEALQKTKTDTLRIRAIREF